MGLKRSIGASVETGELADGSVTTPKLAASAVTAAKLGTDAVTTVKVLDAAITAAKLAASSVTDAKVATGAAIATAKLAFSVANTGLYWDAANATLAVGTNTPSANHAFHGVTATDEQMRLENSVSGKYAFMGWSNTDDLVRIGGWTGASFGNMFLPGGNFGIGVVPLRKLHINGSDAARFAVGADGVEILQTTAGVEWQINPAGAVTKFRLTGFTGGILVGTTGDKVGFYGATPVTQAAFIADPSGGITQDTQARDAIDAILDVMIGLGLIAAS